MINPVALDAPFAEADSVVELEPVVTPGIDWFEVGVAAVTVILHIVNTVLT